MRESTVRVIERCFGRLKQWRRSATRDDRKDRHSIAFLGIAVFLIWMLN